MSTAYTVCLYLNLYALVIMALMLFAALLGGNRGDPISRWFFRIVLFGVLSLLCDAGVDFLMGTPGKLIHFMAATFNTASYLFAAAQMYAFGRYLQEYLLSKRILRSGVPFRIMAVLCGVQAVFAAAASLTPLFARFDENNRYIMQSQYWLSYFVPLCWFGVYLAAILLHIKRLQAREWLPFALYAVIQVTCYVFESIYADIWIAFVGNALVVLILYINIQAENARRQEAKLAEGRVVTMLSQIQPHFMYNTLASINDMASGNPELQQAIVTFANYLRTNMDSLAQEGPIPFEKELEHVRQYLWLEKMRFGGKLHVVYDISATRFSVPVLTVQLIVENAVLHGVTAKVKGGTVTISTEEDDRSFRVMVADDGVGFDPRQAQGDGRSHVGLANVRARLAAVCGGRLIINSAPGTGTTVVIEIPKTGGAPG